MGFDLHCDRPWYHLGKYKLQGSANVLKGTVLMCVEVSLHLNKFRSGMKRALSSHRAWHFNLLFFLLL